MPTLPSPMPKTNRGPAAGPANRQALIAAAREVYAESGLGAPFSAVAKRAGVGQGSLYRHFPDRTALAVAVFEENVADLEEFLTSEDRTVDDLLGRVVDQAVASTAFIELVTADLHDPRIVPLGERFNRVVTRLVVRERSAGRIGAHVEPEDLAMATSMLATELARTEPDQRADVARRARALFRAAFAPR
ncbi:helix-turn-helix domain-containing protein [Microbacterium deminutum]|uniref:HTH tetR-type domain-containing protein n=1 Tax=Microbacterium deminutum TaxID=344164 RepID=A0ABP5BFU2_9MICO